MSDDAKRFLEVWHSLSVSFREELTRRIVENAQHDDARWIELHATVAALRQRALETEGRPMDTQISPTSERDQFMNAARSRILDGKDLYEELGSEIYAFVEDRWRDLSIEAQKFWIDLAASVRASEPIVMKGQLTRETTLVLATEDGNGDPAETAVILEPKL